MASDGRDVHEEDLRTDLEAMLKASRELGPEMDRALVDSYLERQRNALKQRKSEPAPAAMGRSWGGPHPLQVIALVPVLAAIVAVAVFSHGWMLWLIFPFFWVFSPWRWWGHGGRYEYRMARRQAREEYRQRRWQARRDYWHGRSSGDGADQPPDYI